MKLIRTLLLLLVLTFPAVGEQLRLSVMKIQLDYPGRNQPRETRWGSTTDAKYNQGDTNRAAKVREVVLVKEGKGKTFSITVSDWPAHKAQFGTNDLKLMEDLGNYQILSKGFANFLGAKAYRVTGQNAELQGKALQYFFHTNGMQYRITTATMYGEPPESDPEIAAILKSLTWVK